MVKITYDVDDDDYAAIQAAITRWQKCPGVVSDGTGDLGGRILAEVCRGWLGSHSADEGEE